MKILGYKKTGMKEIVKFESFTFSGGEEHIRLDASDFEQFMKLEIRIRLTDSASVMRLLMAADALKRVTKGLTPIELVIPYFPYARQDRVCLKGEALGASVMATLINQCDFTKVTVWDVHSDVSTALIHRVENIQQSNLLKEHQQLWLQLRQGEVLLVAPDAGASKKTQGIAAELNGVADIVQAHKVRNLKTGAIERTELYGSVTGQDVLIVDDICDGGRTFIELAKVLKEKGARRISLFVTHGIFSQGFAVFEGMIDTIYTTDSFCPKADYCTSTNINLQIIEKLG